MLSLVQVWDVSLSIFQDIIPVFNAKMGPVATPAYSRGLTADWAWDSFQPGPGMKRISPSTRGQTICDTGQQLNTTGRWCVDKRIGKPAICVGFWV